MKKFILKITAFLILAIVAVMGAACNFVEKKGDSSEEESTVTRPDYYTETALKNSLELSSEVTFESLHTTEYDKIDDVIENTSVDRAVVNIFCTYGNYRSSASGVIVDVDDKVDYGDLEDNVFYIITCHHVVDELPLFVNNSIEIYLPDTNGNNYNDTGYNEYYKFSGNLSHEIKFSSPFGSSVQPTVSFVGGDKSSDIAVLRLFVANDTLASTVVKAKVMSEENSLKLGEKVFAIGNCLGTHPGWLSSGTISDLRCTSTIAGIGEMTLVGIDVATFPGNSGGGLFNMYGELVGITNSGDVVVVEDVNGNAQEVAQRLNYAVPHCLSTDKTADNGFINIAKQLIGSHSTYNFGYVSARKSKIGFTAIISQDMFGEAHVIVASIDDTGYGYKAGLRYGDTIIGISLNDGEERTVSSLNDLSEVISSAAAGDVITFSIIRSRTTALTVSVTMKQYLFFDTGNYTDVIAE
ncbi:MAG: S1C family serine protease [Clostridia bacterium]|nr:S1C family serine protease [Clostridia bacterium]